MSTGTTGEDVRQALNGVARTITITEAKQLIERAQRDVESILIELQKQTGLRLDYICMQEVATSEDGTNHFNIYISTSIV